MPNPNSIASCLGRDKALIGMVHVGALPGSPAAALPVRELARAASEEARTLEEAGFDSVLVENMHDLPYVHGKHLGPEVVSAMSAVVWEVTRAVKIPVGVQILSGGARHALAVAHTCNAAFIRVENFVFSHIAEEGILPEGEAGTLLRYRREIGAERVRIFADIDKKHAAHAMTADLTLSDWAHAAEFFKADGMIVTGKFTGRPPTPEHLREAKQASKLPVLVGSGATAASVRGMLADSDAVIVGTWIKSGGHWANPVDLDRCRQFVAAARA